MVNVCGRYASVFLVAMQSLAWVVATVRCTPLNLWAGCWNSDIPVPWNESCEVVELGLWSMLSIAAVVKRPPLGCGGHTACSIS